MRLALVHENGAARLMFKPGDLIVAATPAGVDFARKSPLFMKHGDVCGGEVDRIGVFRNLIRDEGFR